MSHIIAPSILAADFANLQRDIEIINQSAAEWIHIDVMDGVFVPNISFGFPILEAVKKHSNKFLDVHLMIVQPEKYIEEFAQKGANGLSVHYEGNLHIHSILQTIRKHGMKAGLVLNPHTPVSLIQELIHDIDTLLIMSVNPGFGGQKFIPYTIEKVKQARKLIDASRSKAIIQVDGGVGLSNAKEILQAGADNLVAGSAVFNASYPLEVINALKNIDILT
jgi:ribulose-phosphate 3-epimerase